MGRMNRYEAMNAGWNWCRRNISLRLFLLHVFPF